MQITGIIGAMDVEVAILRSMMKNARTETVALRKRKLLHASHYSNCFDRDRYSVTSYLLSPG